MYFQSMRRRYNRGSKLVTSNGSIAEWLTGFGDALVAIAILERLLYHDLVITIHGDSYQLRSKRRAGLVNQASAKDAVTTDSSTNQRSVLQVARGSSS